jgi:hypothetical protein
VPRDPELMPYRTGVYAAYGVVCALLFFVLLRSVIGDLYGKPVPPAPVQSPRACLEDIERLYGQLSARAVQPAPRGLDGDALAREWDLWSRQWEDEVAAVTARCRLDEAKGPATQQLAQALEGTEELRRRLSRSGEDAAEDARRVREALTTARELLNLK